MKSNSIRVSILILVFTILWTGCQDVGEKTFTVETDENGYAVLSDEQVKDIVRRSYQYVAMYNVNNKFAARQGWDVVQADTRLKDHTLKDIARPNNDSYYISALLDLRQDPIIMDLPVFGSKYTSLMVTAYDHYVNTPKTTREGDFQKPEKLLFYSDRTEGYAGEKVEGVDDTFKADGDFISVIFRVMPHSKEPERHDHIVQQIGKVKIQTLSEYQGGKKKTPDEIKFPTVGKTDADIFENNLLEVMQFVFNHMTFDSSPLDQKLLEIYQPLGVVPGKEYKPENYPKIDGARFRKVAMEVQQHYLSLLEKAAPLLDDIKSQQFLPKGNTDDLEVLLAVSVIGPIGLPMKEAMYFAVTSKEPGPMNALNDYVIRMSKAELPPAQAFWSLTLYDLANGFFIPNDRKKYSVGENGGMKLNDEGGIDIYVAAEKPEGVPEENWLPINRKDENLDIILRVYVPDLEKVETWKPPKAEKISG